MLYQFLFKPNFIGTWLSQPLQFQYHIRSNPFDRYQDMSLMAQLGPPEASSASTAMVKEFTRELDAATSSEPQKTWHQGECKWNTCFGVMVSQHKG